MSFPFLLESAKNNEIRAPKQWNTSCATHMNKKSANVCFNDKVTSSDNQYGPDEHLQDELYKVRSKIESILYSKKHQETLHSAANLSFAKCKHNIALQTDVDVKTRTNANHPSRPGFVFNRSSKAYLTSSMPIDVHFSFRLLATIKKSEVGFILAIPGALDSICITKRVASHDLSPSDLCATIFWAEGQHYLLSYMQGPIYLLKHEVEPCTISRSYDLARCNVLFAGQSVALWHTTHIILNDFSVFFRC